MPLILPGNVAAATAATTYNAANSCRFDDGDSAGMHKAMGTPSDQDKWTFSCWFKRGNVITGATAYLLSTYVDGSNDSAIRIESNDKLSFYNFTSSSYAGRQRTNTLFRDPAAWYHLVCTYDSGNATAAHRMRMYINGVEETVFDVETNPAEDEDSHINTASTTISLAAQWNGSAMGEEYDGYIAEVYFCDGQAYAASDFGEFDEDSPTMWKAKDASGLTFGTNGFYLDFEASANLGNDANGGTDLTEVNVAATDQAVDTPTNNFCVLNPLDNYYAGAAFTEGNTVTTRGTNNAPGTSTIGLSAGKWYCEAKYISGDYAQVGITDYIATATGDELGGTANSWSLQQFDGQGYRNNNSNTEWGTEGYSANDIISIALDLTNSKLYFAINGTWEESGDPTSGATGTGALSITAVGSTEQGLYFIACGDYDDTGGAVWQMNFGNPTYANSSDAADANGYGAFEYAPPSGYLAICTKNLGSDGG